MPIAWYLPEHLATYTLIVVVAFLIGIWFCEHCTQALGVHDHGAIVWDEWVGFLIAMFALPRLWWVLLLAFILFRAFDILKPWPISAFDRKVHGGLGIMIDDVFAGLMTCGVMHLIMRFAAKLGVI